MDDVGDSLLSYALLLVDILQSIEFLGPLVLNNSDLVKALEIRSEWAKQ